MHRYIKKCSKRKLVKSRYGVVQSSSISLFTTFSTKQTSSYIFFSDSSRILGDVLFRTFLQAYFNNVVVSLEGLENVIKIMLINA